jgi:hypothetical protein
MAEYGGWQQIWFRSGRTLDFDSDLFHRGGNFFVGVLGGVG